MPNAITGKQLDQKPDPVAEIRASPEEKTTTLRFGAKDTEHNNALALKDDLEDQSTAGRVAQP